MITIHIKPGAIDAISFTGAWDDGLTDPATGLTTWTLTADGGTGTVKWGDPAKPAQIHGDPNAMKAGSKITYDPAHKVVYIREVT